MRFTETKFEHNAYCKSIADELSEIARGLVAQDDSGEIYDLTKVDETVVKEYIDRMGLEPYSMADYFDEVYNIDYVVTMYGGELSYKSVKVMIAFGGPNVYVDTETGTVDLYWWDERGTARIDRDTVEEIDYYFEELFNCCR